MDTREKRQDHQPEIFNNSILLNEQSVKFQKKRAQHINNASRLNNKKPHLSIAELGGENNLLVSEASG